MCKYSLHLHTLPSICYIKATIHFFNTFGTATMKHEKCNKEKSVSITQVNTVFINLYSKWWLVLVQGIELNTTSQKVHVCH